MTEKMSKKTTGRAEILARLRAASAQDRVNAKPYRPQLQGDLKAEFFSKAQAADANVHEIASIEAIPTKLQSLFAEGDNQTPLHIAQASLARDLAWECAPKLNLHDTPPGGEALALSIADYGIAETGTLAFLSGAARPSSWHFLPGIECVVLRTTLIVPTLEDLFAQIADAGLPSTLNLVTGPSRTADIEQTIERGAHGPRALHIFMTGD
jgi:L-lactate dehydrogenase complex protein LldG